MSESLRATADYVTKVGRKAMDEGQSERLREAISRFDRMCYPKRVNNQVWLMRMTESPRGRDKNN
jgi:hypothetical protein